MDVPQPYSAQLRPGPSSEDTKRHNYLKYVEISVLLWRLCPRKVGASGTGCLRDCIDFAENSSIIRPMPVLNCLKEFAQIQTL